MKGLVMEDPTKGDNQWHLELRPEKPVIRVLKRTDDKSGYSYKVRLAKWFNNNKTLNDADIDSQ